MINKLIIILDNKKIIIAACKSEITKSSTIIHKISKFSCI